MTLPSAVFGRGETCRFRHFRLALVATTALVSCDAGTAFAAAVTVNGTDAGGTTVPIINTAIQTAEITSADVTVAVPSDATVSGNAAIVIAPIGAGQGDGAIAVINAGQLGTVNAGTVVDATGLALTGIGTVGAANTGTVTNSGLIAGGISATGLGGDVSIVNGGTVFGTVTATGYGNVSLSTDTGSTITVASGTDAIDATALTPSTTTIDPLSHIVTTTYSGGNVSINLAGNALVAGSGTQGADIRATAQGGNGNSTVTIAGTAGQITSIAGSILETTYVSPPPVPGSANYFDQSSVTMGSGASWVTLASGGSVTGIYSSGMGLGTALNGSTVTVSGAVGTSGIVSLSHGMDTLYIDQQSWSGGTRVSENTTGTSMVAGGIATVTINPGGSVAGGGILASGDSGATIIVDGAVQGTIRAFAGGDAENREFLTYAGGRTEHTIDTLYGVGNASIAIADGSATGPVTVIGDLSVQANVIGSVSIGALGHVTGNVAINTQIGPNLSYVNVATDPAAGTGDYASEVFTGAGLAGGHASFTNAGYLQGSVSLTGLSNETTLTNTGQVTGTTYVTTQATPYQSTDTASSQVTSVSGTATTVTASSSVQSLTNPYAGTITGLYAGINGNLSSSPSGGNITQIAGGDTSLTLSGTLYADANLGPAITSVAGMSDAQYNALQSSTLTTTTDSANHANDVTTSNAWTISRAITPGGTSTVSIDGLVSNAVARGSADVSSTGTTASTVTVTGTVKGSVSSVATGQTFTDSIDRASYTTVGAQQLTSQKASLTDTTTTLTSGAAVGNVAGHGLVEGNLFVTGVVSATSTIDANAVVDGVLNVESSGISTSWKGIYDTYNADFANQTATRLIGGPSGSVVSTGYASAIIDGKVTGNVDVGTLGTNASAQVSGKIGGAIVVSSGGGSTSSSSQYIYNDKLDSNGQVISSTLSRPYITGSGQAVESTARLVIDTSAAWQATGVGSTIPSVNRAWAYGDKSTEVLIEKGSWVEISAYSESYSVNYSSTSTLTTTGSTNVTTTQSYFTPVGEYASLINNGKIGNGLMPSMAEVFAVDYASMVNNGSVTAILVDTLNSKQTGTSTYTEVPSDPSQRVQITTNDRQAFGGTASLINNGTTGAVTIGGITGIVENHGTINDSIQMGVSAWDFITTSIYDKSNNWSGPDKRYTRPNLPSQTYEIKQFGKLYGTITTTGAYLYYVDEPLHTSNVSGTVDLESGSVTVGTFYVDSDTKMTANVRGGSLLLSGRAYVAPAEGTYAAYSAGLDPTWFHATPMSENGTFLLNVIDGTVSIARPAEGSNIFGINGSIDISGGNGTLVLGVVEPPATTGSAPTVTGTDLLVTGDFSNSSTLVTGLNGTLVRSPTSASPYTATALIASPSTVTQANYTTPAAAALAGGAINTPSSVTVGGNLDLGGTVVVYAPYRSIFTGTEATTLFTVGGTITNTAKIISNLHSPFVGFELNTIDNQVVLSTKRTSYASVAQNPNQTAVGLALDHTIPGVVGVMSTIANGGTLDPTVEARLPWIEDMADVISTMDWTLGASGATAALNEIASASIYGSLANVRQNGAFESALNAQLARHGEGMGGTIGLWATPIGTFARYDGNASGAASIHVNSYGGAAGVDVPYDAHGAIGVGFGYTRHSVDARGAPGTATADTYSLGAYWTRTFGRLVADAQFAFGATRFDVQRTLSVLGRRISGHVRSREFDGSIGLSWKLTSGSFEATPYGRIGFRRWIMDGFSESDGGALGLDVAKADKTIFNPVVGLTLARTIAGSGSLRLQPYAGMSYTFQGDAGTARTMHLQGDPDTASTFVLNGVNPKGFATAEGGIRATIGNRASMTVGGSYGFGNANSIATVRGIFGVRF